MSALKKNGTTVTLADKISMYYDRQLCALHSPPSWVKEYSWPSCITELAKGQVGAIRVLQDKLHLIRFPN